mgnify:CR=1 FL=1
MITLEAIVAARDRISPHVYRTPLVHSLFLSDLTGGEVYLKLECQQKLNAFKIRGMLNRVLTMTPEERERGIMVVSSGNFGIAAGYVRKMWGVDVEVYVPEATPPSKIERIVRYGAKPKLVGRDYNEAYAAAKETSRHSPRVWLDSSGDEDAVAGYGSIGLEIVEDLPEVDTILVPVGGGGLITGISLAAKGKSPEVEVLGVQTEACPAMLASLRDGICYEQYPSEPSMCEGLVGGVVELPFSCAERCIDDVLLASEEAIGRAVVELISQEKVVAEPSGAAGVAYIIENPALFRDRKVAVVISGGNIDAKLLAELMGRYSLVVA